MRRVRSVQGDSIDSICWRYLGHTQTVVETVLELNPGLAGLGAVLPSGTEVILPAQETQLPIKKTVKLWD